MIAFKERTDGLHTAASQKWGYIPDDEGNYEPYAPSRSRLFRWYLIGHKDDRADLVVTKALLHVVRVFSDLPYRAYYRKISEAVSQ